MDQFGGYMTRGEFTYHEIISQGKVWEMTLDSVEPIHSRLNELLQKPW